jgi:biopolymer transport protein ExbB/TolQ
LDNPEKITTPQELKSEFITNLDKCYNNIVNGDSRSNIKFIQQMAANNILEPAELELLCVIKIAIENNYSNDSLLSQGHTIIEDAEKRLDNNRFLWNSFIGSLAALGFLGTVWGIGEALMGTSSVLSDELAKQQSGVSSISLALGIAFDTTMVSLTLSLIASFGAALFAFGEKRYILDLEKTFIQLVRQIPTDLVSPQSPQPNNSTAGHVPTQNQSVLNPLVHESKTVLEVMKKNEIAKSQTASHPFIRFIRYTGIIVTLVVIFIIATWLWHYFK